MLNRVSFVLAVLALTCASVLAGKITLNDGTVVEGEIKKVGSSYSVKTKDGSLKLIPGKDVASVDDGTSPATGSKPATPGTPGTKPPAVSGAAGTLSDDYVKTARAAERSEQPLLAATLWQKYIDEHPGALDLEQAKAEQKRWQEMADKGAEKIRGKWVVGDDLKKIHEQVGGLLRDYMQLMQNEQTLKAIPKLEEVIKIYPNSFEAHFELGYFYLVKGGNTQYDKAISSLEQASRLRPNSPETFTNLAIAYNFRKRYEDSVVAAYKAAQIEDSKPVVQNLINALSYAPPGMRQNNPKVKPIVGESGLLASRHGIGGPANQWIYMRPKPREMEPGKGSGPEGTSPAQKGIVGSGTGFFVTADGYILTNRHVAAGGNHLIVLLSDGTRKIAEKVHIDDKQDIAILRIKSDSPTPFIKLAAYDAPPMGTDVTVMGFPLGAALGTNVKITRGVVTAVEDKPECDVIVDAQVNPGNSGGPMIDKHGNLLALVAMKSFADATVSSYGLGISTGRLRKYFDQQKEKLTFKLEPGAAGTAPLSTEDIAQRFTKATVMILIVAGDMPEAMK